jgi:hypothetical protein
VRDSGNGVVYSSLPDVLPFDFGEAITTDIANYHGTDLRNYGIGPRGKE